jgi:ELWxxDGT repeat protein
LPVVSNTLTCAVSGSTDADGDTITISRRWINNGTQISGQTGSTLAMASLGSSLLFIANKGTVGAEQYVTDGTSNGTVLVTDIRVGTSSSSPRNFAKLGSSAVFLLAMVSSGSSCG